MTETPTPRPAAPFDLERPAPWTGGRPERARRVPPSAPAPRRPRRSPRQLLAAAPHGVQRAAAETKRAVLVFAAAAAVLLLLIGPCVAGLIWEWQRLQ